VSEEVVTSASYGCQAYCRLSVAWVPRKGVVRLRFIMDGSARLKLYCSSLYKLALCSVMKSAAS
jgi:hypothetical protein